MGAYASFIKIKVKIMSCPTIKVKYDNEQGSCIINESDFDESKHELFTEDKEIKIKANTQAWFAAKLNEKGIEFDVDASRKDLKAIYEESK